MAADKSAPTDSKIGLRRLIDLIRYHLNNTRQKNKPFQVTRI
jgi:hypothetical protein